MDPINTLPLEGWAYKITDRPCPHFKDGRRKGDCSTCTREVLAQAVETETAKLRAEMEGRDKEWYGKLQGADEALHLANLQIDALKSRIEPLLKTSDDWVRTWARATLSLVEKPKADLAICGWCAGTGKDYGKDCSKCHGAGGFIQKRVETPPKKLCGVWVREMGPCVAAVPCKAHPEKQNDNIPDPPGVRTAPEKEPYSCHPMCGSCGERHLGDCE